jgi:hypothetical protein
MTYIFTFLLELLEYNPLRINHLWHNAGESLTVLTLLDFPLRRHNYLRLSDL